MHLSIISPVYKAENIVPHLVERIIASLDGLTDTYEIILIEDGSPDNSWSAIEAACEKNRKVRGIKLSRNFGQHNAITAGLKHAAGDWIIVMDCDLQDRPEEIPQLYKKAQEGYEIVLARRVERQDRLLKRFTSRLFYRVFSYLTDTRQDASIANFGIYHRKVIQSVLSMGDQIRVFPILLQWVGFRRTTVDVHHSDRLNGVSSYSIGKLLRLAFNMILSFSEKPLRIGLQAGIVIASGAILFGGYTFIRYLRGEIGVPGYASLIVSIWFLSGTIIAFIGLAGLYIGKIFEKVRNRPNFIIQETINQRKNE